VAATLLRMCLPRPGTFLSSLPPSLLPSKLRHFVSCTINLTVPSPPPSLPLQIRGWRDVFRNSRLSDSKPLPFGFVQLHSYDSQQRGRLVLPSLPPSLPA